MVRAMLVLGILCVSLGLNPLSCLADDTGTLRIEYEGLTGQGQRGVTFEAFDVGTSEGPMIDLDPPFDEYAAKVNGDSDEALANAATALEAEIAERRLPPDATATTDEQGVAEFPPLDKAVYLVVGELAEAEADAAKPQAFFTTETGVAHPKPLSLAAERPTAPAPDSGPPPADEPVADAPPDAIAPEEPSADGGVFAKTADRLAMIGLIVGGLGLIGALLSAAVACRTRRVAVITSKRQRGWK